MSFKARGLIFVNATGPVEAGIFMWLSAYLSQACYREGDERFRYLLYKDVNACVSI